MPLLVDYHLKGVNIQATLESRWQLDDTELDKLLDPRIKAFFLVCPGSPSAVTLSAKPIAKIGAVIKMCPAIIPITDDVYGTFVPGFLSLLGAFPHNITGICFHSTYFGCACSGLGVIVVHEDNLFDTLRCNWSRC
jgi:aspartate 4-decarboxylase